MLHVAFVRSPFAHARITRVDVSRALQSPGVIAAFSGADFADEQGSLPCAWPVTPDIVIPAHPPMATDEVRYVGEAVACVVARDRYEAADALDAIDVDYEPLPPVLDIRTALDESSPKVHEAGNKSFEWVFGNGDIDAAFSRRPGGPRAELPPAAADPQRHGTARGGGLERGRRVHAVVVHPDPARAAGHAGPGHRHPGAQPPGHRARRGRWLRLQAAGDGRGSAGPADLPQGRPAGQVDRVAQRRQHDRAPRPGPVAADQGRRGRGTAGCAACPWTCWPTWAPT